VVDVVWIIRQSDCMRLPWRHRPHELLPADRGLLALVEQPDVPVRDVFVMFRELVSSDMEWASSRKSRFRANAARTRVATLMLTAASTVVLGIAGIPARATVALPMVALVSVLSAVDTFFSWRSHWILMEETQYRLNQLRDEIDYYLVTTRSSQVTKGDLDAFFQRQQKIWAEASRRWVEFRKLESGGETRFESQASS